MRNLHLKGNIVETMINTEFLDNLEMYRIMNKVDTLEEMIQRSRFEIDDELYEFRYDEELSLDIYDLYREWLEDGHRRYSVTNPDNYKIIGFSVEENDNKFRFKLSLKK